MTDSTKTLSTRLLSKGTKFCPKDKAPLLWEKSCGLNVIRKRGGYRLYQTRCSKCGFQWRVKV